MREREQEGEGEGERDDNTPDKILLPVQEHGVLKIITQAMNRLTGSLQTLSLYYNNFFDIYIYIYIGIYLFISFI